jgi:hypothetical protein
MERIKEDAVDLIDLGAASVETRGVNAGTIDGAGLQQKPGLSND